MLCAAKEVVNREGLAGRCCVGQKKRVEVIDCFRARELAEGEVTLHARGPSLNHRAKDADNRNYERQGCHPDGGTIAPYKFTGAIRKRIWPRANWLPGQIAANVIGKGRNRCVALPRSFLKCLRDNGVQVSPQQTAQLPRRGASFCASRDGFPVRFSLRD